MDPEFFEMATMPLFDQLYNCAHWLTGDTREAEDLVQETYAQVLKGFKSFEEGTNLRGWMHNILRNTFLISRSGLRAQRTASFEDNENVDELVVHHALAGLPAFIAR
jgi:RNA polymerase sigma-70 factor (ECF subfamily)